VRHIWATGGGGLRGNYLFFVKFQKCCYSHYLSSSVSPASDRAPGCRKWCCQMFLHFCFANIAEKFRLTYPEYQEQTVLSILASVLYACPVHSRCRFKTWKKIARSSPTPGTGMNPWDPFLRIKWQFKWSGHHGSNNVQKNSWMSVNKTATQNIRTFHKKSVWQNRIVICSFKQQLLGSEQVLRAKISKVRTVWSEELNMSKKIMAYLWTKRQCTMSEHFIKSLVMK
jgi:hypothetical protein